MRRAGGPRPRVAVLVVSSAVAAGAAADEAGPRLSALLEEVGADVACVEAVSDQRELIEQRLRAYAAEEVDVVLTAGGTGLTPDDVTPEATGAVIEREVPGFAEALRAQALRHTPMGVLNRGRAGIAGRTLFINLPGSPKAVEELFGVLAPVLGHAVATIRSSGGSRRLHEAGHGDGGA